VQTIGYKSSSARAEIVENKVNANIAEAAEATKVADEVIALMLSVLTSTNRARQETYDELFKLVVTNFELLDYKKDKKSSWMPDTLQEAIVLLAMSKKSRHQISGDTTLYADDPFQYQNIINFYDVASTLIDLETCSTYQIEQTLCDYKQSVYQGFHECGLQVLINTLIDHYLRNIKGAGFCFAKADGIIAEAPEFSLDLQLLIKSELPFASKGYVAFSITNKFHNELHEKSCILKLTADSESLDKRLAQGLRAQEIFSRCVSSRLDEWSLLYSQNLDSFLYRDRPFGPITIQRIKNKEITVPQAEKNYAIVKEIEGNFLIGRKVYIKYLADGSMTKHDIVMLLNAGNENLEDKYIESYIDIGQLSITEAISLTGDEKSILTNPLLHKNIVGGSITIKQIFKLKEPILHLLKDSNFRIQQFQHSLEESVKNIPGNAFGRGYLDRKKNEEKIVFGEKVLTLIKNKVQSEYWF